MIECKTCGSTNIVFWKDAYNRFPHFWACKECGALFDATMTNRINSDDIPEDVKEKIIEGLETPLNECLPENEVEW